MMSTIDNPVRKIRLALFLEQQELAQKLGITKAAIHNYEKGLRHPKLSILRKLRDLAKENGMELSIHDFLN